jgi:hypothetical protein
MSKTSDLENAQGPQSTISQWDLASDTPAQTKPPTDGGRDAWLVLTSGFVLGAIIWGECTYTKLTKSDLTFFGRLSV